jgi:hypothetical protein
MFFDAVRILHCFSEKAMGCVFDIYYENVVCERIEDWNGNWFPPGSFGPFLLLLAAAASKRVGE